jgi:hypothetical protein
LRLGARSLGTSLAEIVKTARGNGWVEAGKAERWLEKLDKGRTMREGWPKYLVRLKKARLRSDSAHLTPTA